MRWTRKTRRSPVAARSRSAKRSCPASRAIPAAGSPPLWPAESPPRRCRKSRHRPLKAFELRRTTPLPSGIAVASWILRRAARSRRIPSNPERCALPRSPRPTPAASPRAPQNHLVSPRFRSSRIPSFFLLHSNDAAGRTRFSAHSTRPFSSSNQSCCCLWRDVSKPTLPAARGEHVFLFQLPHVDSGHRFAQSLACFQNCLRVFEVRGRLHDGFCARIRVAALEDARADEHGLRAQLPYQSRVRRSSNAAGRKIRHRQLAGFRDFANQVQRGADLL